VFGQLREALNTIWEIEPADQRGVWPFIRQRLLPFLLVLASGCLLLGLLLLSTALAAAARYLEGWWPVAESVWYAVDSAASFFIVFLLFALIFKVLPAARVAWRDVWLGAATSAALFLVGKMLVGIYLAHSSIASSYGAAGSLVVLLVWIYYAAQIFFFGAELTQVFAERYGSRKIGRIRTARRGAAIGPAASK
jgi:membrane protein